jgi:hypothetical protein
VILSFLLKVLVSLFQGGPTDAFTPMFTAILEAVFRELIQIQAASIRQPLEALPF